MFTVLRFRLGPPSSWGALLSILLTATSCMADAAPPTIAFQGVLANAAGTPKPDGGYTTTFRLYDAAVAGNLVWTEANKPLVVTGGKGIFSTALGSATPLYLDFSQPYFLEVQVSGDPAMLPRLPLRSVPYALKAASLQLPYAASGSFSGGVPLLDLENQQDATVLLAISHSTEANPTMRVEGWDLGARFDASSASSTAVVGYGVVTGGKFDATADGGTGVAGITHGLGGTAVRGDALGAGTVAVQGTSATGRGVWGRSTSSYGVYGDSDSFIGTRGQSNSYIGVYGQSKTSYGVYGESLSNGLGTGSHGVVGVAHVPGKAGVYAENNAPSAYGLYGTAQGAGGLGVLGTASGDSSSKGVYGSTLHGYGVWGAGDDSGSVGVHGQTASGAYGELGTQYAGSLVYFPQAGSPGVQVGNFSVGVMGAPGSTPHSIGVLGLGNSGVGNFAGAFIGDTVTVGNAYTAFPGSTIADHPLDPANKFLVYTSAQGPEPLDFYKGRVTTDANGEAVVTLPDYFEALNKDFEYQFTCIGQFAQAIVAEEIKDNHFTIKTDKPGVKVSWQVTGVRNDAYTAAHPITVEPMKPESERGRYITPVAFGEPASRGLTYLPPPSQTH